MSKWDSTKSLDIFVTNREGARIGGVEVLGIALDKEYRGITDFQGHLRFKLPKQVGHILIQINDEDFAPFSQDFGIGDLNNINPILDEKEQPQPELPPLGLFPKGNFCGVMADGIQIFKKNGKPTPAQEGLVYAPAYAVYNDSDRHSILLSTLSTFGEWAFLKFNPTTGDVYPGSGFGNIDGTNGRARQFVEECIKNRVVPFVNLLRDEQHDLSEETKSFIDLIRYAFVKWEMNQPDNNDTDLMNFDIWNCRKAIRFDCKLYVHFSPKHGAGIGNTDFAYCNNCFYPGMLNVSGPCPNCGKVAGTTLVKANQDDSNANWWQWAAKVGVQGLLLEGDWEENLVATIDFVTDFTIRFGTGFHGWPTFSNWNGTQIPMEAILDEFKVFPTFHGLDGWTVEKSNQFNTDLRIHTYEGMQPQGYLNG